MEVITGLPNCPLDKVVKGKGCSHQSSVSLLCNRVMTRFSNKEVLSSELTTSYAERRNSQQRDKERRETRRNRGSKPHYTTRMYTIV